MLNYAILITVTKLVKFNAFDYDITSYHLLLCRITYLILEKINRFNNNSALKPDVYLLYLINY